MGLLVLGSWFLVICYEVGGGFSSMNDEQEQE